VEGRYLTLGASDRPPNTALEKEKSLDKEKERPKQLQRKTGTDDFRVKTEGSKQ
jgi:hypothetical protein